MVHEFSTPPDMSTPSSDKDWDEKAWVPGGGMAWVVGDGKAWVQGSFVYRIHADRS